MSAFNTIYNIANAIEYCLSYSKRVEYATPSQLNANISIIKNTYAGRYCNIQFISLLKLKLTTAIQDPFSSGQFAYYSPQQLGLKDFNYKAYWTNYQNFYNEGGGEPTPSSGDYITKELFDKIKSLQSLLKYISPRFSIITNFSEFRSAGGPALKLSKFSAAEIKRQKILIDEAYNIYGDSSSYGQDQLIGGFFSFSFKLLNYDDDLFYLLKQADYASKTQTTVYFYDLHWSYEIKRKRGTKVQYIDQSYNLITLGSDYDEETFHDSSGFGKEKIYTLQSAYGVNGNMSAEIDYPETEFFAVSTVGKIVEYTDQQFSEE